MVHGDYKLDNVVIDPSSHGHALAVLDWEMATLGDPLTDLVNLVIWWDGVLDADGTPFAAVPADVPAFPASTWMLDRYASTTATDLEALPWYQGLAFYKLAAIFEEMYYRDRQGLTVGVGFDRLSGPGAGARPARPRGPGRQRPAGMIRSRSQTDRSETRRPRLRLRLHSSSDARRLHRASP